MNAKLVCFPSHIWFINSAYGFSLNFVKILSFCHLWPIVFCLFWVLGLIIEFLNWNGFILLCFLYLIIRYGFLFLSQNFALLIKFVCLYSNLLNLIFHLVIICWCYVVEVLLGWNILYLLLPWLILFYFFKCVPIVHDNPCYLYYDYWLVLPILNFTFFCAPIPHLLLPYFNVWCSVSINTLYTRGSFFHLF